MSDSVHNLTHSPWPTSGAVELGGWVDGWEVDLFLVWWADLLHSGLPLTHNSLSEELPAA